MAFTNNYIPLERMKDELNAYPFTEGISKREVANHLISLLKLIGPILPTKRTYKTLKLDQHRADLPKGMLRVHGVNYKGDSEDNKGVAMRYASDIYNSALHSDTAKAECSGEKISKDNISHITTGVLSNGLMIPSLNMNRPNVQLVENSYTFNGEQINTSMPYGYVEIAYDEIVSDEDGYPLIPDTAEFRQALKYYILRQKVEPEYFRGEVRSNIYNEILKQYAFYVGSATNSFNMPSPDQMETMIRGLVRLLPTDNNITDGWKGFKNR